MRFDMSVAQPTLRGVGGVGRAGMVFLLLFALPFLGFGLFALLWGLHEWRRGDAAQAGMLLLFGALFVGVGVGIALLARRGRRAARQLEERRARHPDEPWLWNEAWAQGRLRCSARSSMRTAWLFAIAWNAVVLSVAFLAPGELAESGNEKIAIAVIFLAVGVGLLAWALHATWRWRRFGESVFEMLRVPGVLGGELAGTLQVGGELSATDAVTARLSCIHRYVTGSGKNRSTHEDIRWSDEQRLPATALARGPFGHALNLRFELPYDAKPSDAVASDDMILWRLEVQTRMPGVDYRARFEIPVFETPESRSERTADALARERHAGDATPFGRLPSGIEVGPNERGDLEIFFPPHRHKSASFLMSLFGLAFGVAAAVLYSEGAGLAFAAAFGAVSAIILYAALGLWTGSVRITANRGDLTVRRRLLGIGRTRSVPVERIEGLTLETGMRVGNSVTWDLHLRTRAEPGRRARSGAGLRLGGNIRDRREAERLAQLLRDAIGR
ncbi:MAG TPA: hypothetical protein VIY27_12205 [Myxococcota bacterium]